MQSGKDREDIIKAIMKHVAAHKPKKKFKSIGITAAHISINRLADNEWPCVNCHGSGMLGNEIKCDICNGTGKITYSEFKKWYDEINNKYNNLVIEYDEDLLHIKSVINKSSTDELKSIIKILLKYPLT